MTMGSWNLIFCNLAAFH